ncbi:MAG: hypothetical protein ACTHJT_12680 [Cytophaga sp.]|uniref:hypothetical protein n=1 Tax=Cytophaga sp. TaxID=29535 RepID=UPI003F7D436E
MKKILLLSLAMNIYSQLSFAQTASDVLENGVHLKDGEKLFLLFETNKLKFEAAKSIEDPANPVSFSEVLEDSMIFLENGGGVGVYIRPLNPLNYSCTTENKIIVDPVDESAAAALGSIIKVLSNVNKSGGRESFTEDSSAEETDIEICEYYMNLKKLVVSIQTQLSDNQKNRINEIFKNLKNLTFIDETSTKDKLAIIKTDMDEVETHFIDISKLIDKGKTATENYACPYPETFMTQFMFNTIFKELTNTLNEQKKRLTNLQAAYNLVKSAQEKASIGGGVPGLRWCFKLESVPVKEGKISVYTVTIKENGLKLSEDGEIVNVETKEVLKTTFRTRRFSRFIPEASVGTAFTFLKYNSYGTTSDSTGQQYVGTPTANTLKNLNVTTMINWNYYIPNSPIHPLYQIGVGINSGMPTLFTGFGIRSNVGLKRLTISGGIAATWLQELNTLKVGDKVSGTDDINKDFKYSSSPTFTPYFGIQYNFK